MLKEKKMKCKRDIKKWKKINNTKVREGEYV
jgi:hypothetical protein